MAIPLRGWARPRSAAARLAACEQLIGHNFNNLDLLRQALDSRELVSRRLAVIGDRAVETHLAHRWWEKKDLDSAQWQEMRVTVLCNENLSNVGFRMGINECTTPDSCDRSMTTRMATTIEAVLAAVWVDTNRDAAALDKVIDRLGLTHILLDAGTPRAWLYAPITSSRTLSRRFFSGHHLALTKALSQLEQIMIPPRVVTSEEVRLVFNEPSIKQEIEPESSEAQKPGQASSSTWDRLKYIWVGNDAISQLSRQISPRTQPKSKSPVDPEQPERNEGVRLATDDVVHASLLKDQGTERSAPSDVDVKEGGQGFLQSAHDENSLLMERAPKNEEISKGAPINASSEASDTRKLQVKDLDSSSADVAGTDVRASLKKSSENVILTNAQGVPERDSGTQNDVNAREQERLDMVQALEKRISKLSKKQSAKPNDTRLEILNETMARLEALKENTVEHHQ
ncbi:Ribonuclease 3 [Cytospora mali]|uniref:Ribonuclease 3 n=1 Tax=Cytospora mali TaxID=578113 RepID=A0A194VGN4_CYTMA|nr:Ribonuclease 3 [Valsa mali var. pyri (nom. inval.)]